MTPSASGSQDTPVGNLSQLTSPFAANSTTSENAAVLPGFLKLGTRSQHLPGTNSVNPPGNSRRPDNYHPHHPCSTDGKLRHGEVELFSHRALTERTIQLEAPGLLKVWGRGRGGERGSELRGASGPVSSPWLCLHILSRIQLAACLSRGLAPPPRCPHQPSPFWPTVFV